LAEHQIQRFRARRRQLLLQLDALPAEILTLLLVNSGLGGPRLDLLELPLVILPFPIVIVGQHPDGRGQHKERRHAEDDVHQPQVAPGGFGGRHVLMLVTNDEGLMSGGLVSGSLVRPQLYRTTRHQATRHQTPHSPSITKAQKLRKYSGMLMMYFKFTVHRSTIFSGSDSMNNSRFDISM
jgi:hypothetical protein